MNITVLAVGRIKEKYINSGLNEYLKRLVPYAKFEIFEVPDEKAPEKLSKKEEEQVKQREGEKLLQKINNDQYVIALDIQGKTLTSEQFAKTLADLGLKGRSNIVFMIGGSLGLHSSVLERADFKISFGKMTFPHQLMRLILLEQIYRAFKINRGEPYHK